GSLYLLTSVGVTIYRRQYATPTGSPPGGAAPAEQLENCFEELSDVTQGLARHLENFHHLVAQYDAAEVQRWADNRSFWLSQWKVANDHCQFATPRAGAFKKDWEQLAAVHAELREIEASYTEELRRFGHDHAPAMDRVRARLGKIGKHLTLSQDSQPAPDARDGGANSTDSGDPRHE
ncbi:MAG TPA: hypothetical protein VFH73_13025, partial [Polyangia bacterium]|nr:hypothetical protein [Polyangia bacterium]